MGSEYRIEKSEREDNKMDNRYEVDGFLFEIPTEYEKAKKEYEAIRYIKTKTDLDNTANVAKLYNKLLEKQNFITPVGLSFLKELRTKLIQSQIITENDLQKIAVKRERPKQSKSLEAFQQAEDKKYQSQVFLLNAKLRNTKLVCGFLIAIVIVLFGLTIYFRSSPTYDQEMQIQNKYAAWEQELTQREEALRQREEALKN